MGQRKGGEGAKAAEIRVELVDGSFVRRLSRVTMRYRNFRSTRRETLRTPFKCRGLIECEKVILNEGFILCILCYMSFSLKNQYYKIARDAKLHWKSPT